MLTIRYDKVQLFLHGSVLLTLTAMVFALILMCKDENQQIAGAISGESGERLNRHFRRGPLMLWKRGSPPEAVNNW